MKKDEVDATGSKHGERKNMDTNSG